MASQDIKRLRILTGVHAGACVDLIADEHTLGNDHALDIAITDWTEPLLRLRCGSDGVLVGHWQEAVGPQDANAAADGGPPQRDRNKVFYDFEPQAFGDVVLCVGPSQGEWPSDMELLGRAFEPTPARLAQWAGSRLRRVSAFVISSGLVLIAALWLSVGLVQTGTEASVAPPPTLPQMARTVQQTLTQAGHSGLQVHEMNGQIELSGLVASRDDAAAVRTALASLPESFPVVSHIAVVQDLTEAIRSSAGLVDAQVKYIGAGVFSVTAESADPAATRQLIDRVAADLAPHVKRIDITLERTESSKNPVPVLSSSSDGEVSVVQARDGSKYVVINPADSPEAAPPVLPTP